MSVSMPTTGICLYVAYPFEQKYHVCTKCIYSVHVDALCYVTPNMHKLSSSLSSSLLVSSVFFHILTWDERDTDIYHPIYIIMAELNILSVNCQGIGLLPKRTDVLSYLKGKGCQIYCLQYTHFSPGVDEKFLDHVGIVTVQMQGALLFYLLTILNIKCIKV